MNLDRTLQFGSSVKKIGHMFVEHYPSAFGSNLIPSYKFGKVGLKVWTL